MDKQQWIDRCAARYLSESKISSAEARDYANNCWELRLSDDDSPELAADSDMSYWEGE